MTIEVTRQDAIATVTVNRPDALNAFNSDLLSSMLQTLNELRNDSSVRVVVITGAGDRAFIAGADISEMKDKNSEQAAEFAKLGHGVCDAIASMPQPVIAAINGFALGGGCEVALACDIRLASENARLGQPEVGLGIPPGWGATQRLPHIVGVGLAKELIYTGRHVSAGEAKEIGLVNAVYPAEQLLDEAYELAEKIAANGPRAITASKELINASMEMSLSDGKQLEKQRFAEAFSVGEQTEGMSAFLERRKPNFDDA